MLKRLTKLPPSIADEIGADLLHAQAHRRDLVAIDARSRVLAWSILHVDDRREGELAALRSPLRRAAARSATISSWLAVEAITNSTGKMPGARQRRRQERPARARPGSSRACRDSSSWIWKMLRLRSSHGFTSMPPKPPFGNVIWKLWSNSGVDCEDCVDLPRCTASSCSSVALAGTSMRAEHDALIFVGRELRRREHVHRDDAAARARSTPCRPRRACASVPPSARS